MSGHCDRMTQHDRLGCEIHNSDPARLRARTRPFGRSFPMQGKVTISHLQQMKREGQKSVGLVAWDYQIARIADRAGFDFISVGDSVGVNLWGGPTCSMSRSRKC